MIRTGIAATVVLCAVGGGCSSGDDERRLVFAASSLTPAIELIDEASELTGERANEWVLAGSQRLVAQVLDGARPDVVITADRESLEPVLAADHDYDEQPLGITNRLALAVPTGNPARVEGLDDLARSELLVGWCAEAVPCGRLARQVADTNGLTVAADTEEPSVRSLATKIAEGELDAGLVYVTDIAAVDGVEMVADARLDEAATIYAMAVRNDATARETADGIAAAVQWFQRAGFEIDSSGPSRSDSSGP